MTIPEIYFNVTCKYSVMLDMKLSVTQKMVKCYSVDCAT